MRFRLYALLIVLAVTACVSPCVLSVVAFYVVAPSFGVAVSQSKQGPYSIRIEKNFVVNSIRSIRVIQDGTDLAMVRGVFVAPQTILLPSSIAPGTTVTVECELQYDRIAPSIGTVQREVFLK